MITVTTYINSTPGEACSSDCHVFDTQAFPPKRSLACNCGAFTWGEAVDAAMIAPVPSFSTVEEANAWMESVVDDSCIDNHRFVYIDKPVSLIGYWAARDLGCCGFFDEIVTVAGRRARIGCNFGH